MELARFRMRRRDMGQGVIDFLQTKRSKEELKIALDVLREFKGHESPREWLLIGFKAWQKIEQLEEFLAHLVEGSELREDTMDALNRVEEKGKKDAHGHEYVEGGSDEPDGD